MWSLTQLQSDVGSKAQLEREQLAGRVKGDLEELEQQIQAVGSFFISFILGSDPAERREASASVLI